MNIYESAEDYLESIVIIQNKKGSCRAIDIANELGFSKPSVSVALKKLKESGYINICEHGHIELTDAGKSIADKVYERHLILTSGLIALGVSPEQAEIDACKIEHDLSDETFDAIRNHFKK